MKTVLGINAFHGDSAACLLINGVLVAAAEEERFRRVKHWAGLPSQAASYCLTEAGINLSEVDTLAINSNPKAAILRKVLYAIRSRPTHDLIASRVRNIRKRHSVGKQLSTALGQEFKGRVALIEHHRAHLSSAFHASPFHRAVVLSIDGFGDFASAAWGVGQGSRIDIDSRIFFPHSLGIFYQALTQYLGFTNYGDEYKVMGLAPYGRPVFADAMREIVQLNQDGSYKLNLRFFRHHRERFQYAWDGCEPCVGALYTPEIELLLGSHRPASSPIEQRHKDIAHSVQAMYEEAFFHLLGALHRRYRIDQLALAGGCAMNSVANGKITGRTPFKEVYVQSAAGDAGGAIGAAFASWHDSNSDRKRCPMDHAYWGPSYNDQAIYDFLAQEKHAITQARCTLEHIDDEATLCRRTAQVISEGKVVGWFQGRMEWGPRALGNRSILGDPRRTDMKDILNRKIKRRESFRPFAPSVLREAVPEWFEMDGDVPFMMQVYPIRETQRAMIPAVTHVDGTGRLQTVTREANPRYYKLIECFRALTGIPMILNTSFNENEPVVCKPAEALDCFLRTRMDMLVLGDHVIARQD